MTKSVIQQDVCAINDRRTTPNRVVFILSYTSDFRELEWCLPYIAEFSRRGSTVDVLFPCGAISERTRMLMEWTAAYANCRQLADFDPLGWLYSPLCRLAEGQGLLAKAARAYTEIGHRGGVLLGLQQWRWSRLYRRILRWLHGADASFISYQSLYALPGSGALLMYQPALDSGLPILWLPQGIGDPCDTPFDAKGPQIYLAHNKKDCRFFLDHGHHAAVVGAPRFDRGWLAEICEFFDTKFSAPPPAVPPGRKSILLITKNENSPVWQGLDFVAETSRFLKTYVDRGLYMIVKPHPGQNLELLSEILSTFPCDSYIIDLRPLSYWAQKVDFCATQLSSGVLDAVAVGLKYNVDGIASADIPVEATSNSYDTPESAARDYVKAHIRTWANSGDKAEDEEKQFAVKFSRDISLAAAADICEAFIADASLQRFTRV